MQPRTSLSLLTLAVVSISAAATGHPRVQQTWRLVEELRIGPTGEGPTSFATIRALEVDRAGRIYVLENQPQDIRVFAPDGRFLRHVGRPGAGPGEYQNAASFAWDSLGRLLVVDEQSARNSYFDTSGAFIESRVRPVSGFYGWNWGGAVLADGRTIEMLRIPAGGDTRGAFARVDAQGRLRDTLMLPPGPAVSWQLQRGARHVVMQVPFSPRSFTAIDPRGFVWVGRSDRYRITQLSLRGDTVRTIERRVRTVPVARRDVDSIVESVAARFGPGPDIDRSLVPDSKPYFSAFFADDEGRLWVRVPVAAGARGTMFDVFDREGRYLASPSTPLSLGLNVLVRRGMMYAAGLGEDDVPFVARLRLDATAR